MRVDDRVVGWALGGAMVAQGCVLALMARPRAGVLFQLLLASALLGAAVQQAWLHRMQLDHHVDMGLVMVAFGGLGMVLGWWADMALELHPYHSLAERVFSLMTGGMLVGSIPLSLALTRCAVLARESRSRWIITHVVGNVAMIAGMLAGGRLLGRALGTVTGVPLLGGHLAMLIGMVVGMEAGMLGGEALAGLAPWHRRAVPAPPLLRRAGDGRG